MKFNLVRLAVVALVSLLIGVLIGYTMGYTYSGKADPIAEYNHQQQIIDAAKAKQAQIIGALLTNPDGSPVSFPEAKGDIK